MALLVTEFLIGVSHYSGAGESIAQSGILEKNGKLMYHLMCQTFMNTTQPKTRRNLWAQTGVIHKLEEEGSESTWRLLAYWRFEQGIWFVQERGEFKMVGVGFSAGYIRCSTLPRATRRLVWSTSELAATVPPPTLIVVECTVSTKFSRGGTARTYEPSGVDEIVGASVTPPRKQTTGVVCETNYKPST